MIKRFVAALFAVVFMCLPVNGQTEKLSFSTSLWPPYIIMENDKVSGIHTDIIREACRQLKIEPLFLNYPWKRALISAEEGKADAIFSPVYNEDRAKFLYFPSEPLSVTKNSIFARKSDNIKIKDINDLKDKTVGIVRAYSYGSNFDNYQGIKKIECNNDEELIRILNGKRIDMIAIQGEEIFNFICKSLGFEHENFEPVYLISEDSPYVGFSKKALGEKGKLLSEKFSEVLKKMKKEGIVQQITDKYIK